MSRTELTHVTDIHSIYNDHHNWLKGWLRRRLGSEADAADLAHDTFMRLLAREPASAIAEPRAFLTTLAKRVLSNHWRRERVEKAYLEALVNQPETFALSAEEQVLLMEALVEIDRMLDGLPVIVRRAFLHAQLDGMKHQEIAAALGISVSTVQRHLRRAGLQCYFAVAE